jgi:DUF2911 family protein
MTKMKKVTITKVLFLTLVGMSISLMILCQGNKSKRPSPPATATGKVNGATITIDYSSPSVKGRKIWGELVPYDKVWRTGANEATLFSTDKEISVEGKSLPAGKYSLYTIPGEKEWVFIFNSQTGQSGVKANEETSEDPAKDVLRVTVKPEKSASFNERMKFEVGQTGFSLLWENLKVPVSVR